MLFEDLIDVPIDPFGGYCPAIPPDDLPPGAASIAQDVTYPQGGVRTRGGLQNVVFTGTTLDPTAAVNGLKTYLTPSLGRRLMAWDSLGNLFKENPQGTLNLINARGYQNLFYQSQTLFGREYQAFYDSLGGFDIPRQYDDTNWDRVSQEGPGASPSVIDDADSFTIATSPTGLLPFSNSISAVSEVGNIVTVTLTSLLWFGAGVQVGDYVVLAGVTNGAYNGTWQISKIISDSITGSQFQFIHTSTGLTASSSGTARLKFIANIVTTAANDFTVGQQVVVAGATSGSWNLGFTVRSIGSTTSFSAISTTAVPASASGDGTVSSVGNIAAGLHGISVAFITRQGFITQASVPAYWTAAGSKRAIIGDIPTGPPYVVARLLMFTPVITPPAVTGSFYSLPNGSTQLGPTSAMLISDNTTNTIRIDFTDAVLISGFQANYLFSQLELGECAFNIGYNSRLFWMGERNKLNNFVPGSLGFDGGTGPSGAPLGWTPGSSVLGISTIYTNTDWGGAISIVGSVSIPTRGEISQSAYKDYLGVPIILPQTSYTVRVRLRYEVAQTGIFHINLRSISGGFTTSGLAVNCSTIGTKFQEFTAELISNTQITGQVPSDLLLYVYVTGASNATTIVADSIEIYPTNTPFNYSTARCSHAFNPESYDAVTGQIQVRPGDGQMLRSGFPLRNNLYFAKDHYLCYVTDDGVNEPASWAVNEVSATVGICGPNAVDYNEEWAIFAERTGLYICWGSDPVKLTSEVQDDASGSGKVTWGDINWAFAHTIWVRIDKTEKMVLVGAPINGATTPNVVFMFDYQWLDTAADIADGSPIAFSNQSGKMVQRGHGRRWAIWNISANSMTFAERNDGTAQPFYGNGAGNGKIYQMVDCALQPSDDGTAIDSRYQGYGAPAIIEEQVMQLGAHMKLLGYMKLRAKGVGLLSRTISTSTRSNILRPYTLAAIPPGDVGIGVNVSSERFFPMVGTHAVGSWFQLEKLGLCMKKSSAIVVRGTSQ